jgi:hypothetical protein
MTKRCVLHHPAEGRIPQCAAGRDRGRGLDEEGPMGRSLDRESSTWEAGLVQSVPLSFSPALLARGPKDGRYLFKTF